MYMQIMFRVSMTSVDSYRCDSYCLAQLFQNLPVPPKHDGMFYVLADRKNLGSHQAKWPDDRFLPQCKQILANFAKCDPYLSLKITEEQAWFVIKGGRKIIGNNREIIGKRAPDRWDNESFPVLEKKKPLLIRQLPCFLFYLET